MRWRYSLILLILSLYFLCSYIILHSALNEQRFVQRALAVSGQQRTYSQQIAMFADAIAAAESPAARVAARKELSEAIQVFADAHEALTHGDRRINPPGWPTHALREMYFSKKHNVDGKVRAYLAHARAVESFARMNRKIRADNPDLEYLLANGPTNFLGSLESVVRVYNNEQRIQVSKFEGIQIFLLILGVSTLAVIWFTILIPMEREINVKTEALIIAASTDPLTGLLNRIAFAEQVTGAMSQLERRREYGAMVMIDIDKFKSINDTFGHHIGDKAIIQTAIQLKETVRAGEFVTRLGGDEFAVFVMGYEDDEALEKLVKRLFSALQYSIMVDGQIHKISTSVGVSRFPHDGDNFQDLLMAADKALYESKEGGRGMYRILAAPFEEIEMQQRLAV